MSRTPDDETRTDRAENIEADDVTKLGDHFAVVRSQTDENTEYTVDLTAVGDSERDVCECPDHVYRGTSCKHIQKAADALGVLDLLSG